MLAYRGYENISNVNGASSSSERDGLDACYVLYCCTNIHLCVLCTYTTRPCTNPAKLRSPCEAALMNAHHRNLASLCPLVLNVLLLLESDEIA
jgi:hypothetical protein